jgi:hypothetical protein
MKKILILLWRPLNKRKKELLNVESLKKDYKVYFCDITKIIFPQYNKKNILKKNIFKFNDIRNLSTFFYKNNFNLIINHTGISKKSEVYKLLLNLKIPILTYYENQISTHSFYPKRFYYLLKKFLFYKIFSFFKRKNPNEFSYLMSDEIPNIEDIVGTNIIYGKDYILHEPQKKIIAKNKIVFLDQNWGDNEDYNIYYQKNYLTKFKIAFYQELINFLKNVEKEFKVKIIVLLHPYSQKRDWYKYKDFKTCVNNTAKEIKKAKLIIGLWSLSINYAIILRKKILIINSKFLKLVNNYEYSYRIPKWLNNSLPLLISKKNYFKKNEINNFIIKPSSKYKLYKKFFLITKNNKNLSFNSVIKNILK